MSNQEHSVERRLYEAWRKHKGMRLTPNDVQALVGDEAIATRITNTAAIEADIEPPGCDCIIESAFTWKQFKKDLQGG